MLSRFHPLLLSLIAVVISAPAQAAITYSGDGQNIVISNTFDGVFVNFTDPSNATSYTTSITDPGAGNWDINPFFGGSSFGNADTFEVVTSDGTTNSTLQNLLTSDIVGDGLGDGDSFVTGFSGSIDHMDGTVSGEFVAGQEGYIGFRIDDGSSGYYYGWMRVTLNDDNTSGTIRDWAWENTGAAIQVGQIPEPTAFLLGALGSLLLLRRRR